MEEKNCGCGLADDDRPDGCATCRGELVFSYWCDSCRCSVPEKRCPYCGLKAKKRRQEGG